MRITEIYPGEKRYIQPIKFDNAWNKLVVPNCSEILEIYKRHAFLLYRGIDSSNPIIRGSSRDYRTTKDSLPLLSDLFDVGLKECGMTAIRSNSIFAISDKDHAGLFGRLYIIFPIDRFECTFTNFYDLTLNNIYFYIDTWSNRALIQHIDSICPDKLKEYDNWYENPKFFNVHESLKCNMRKINELLSTLKQHPIRPENLIDIDKFKIKVDPQDSKSHLKENTGEVMIKGSYYAFDSNIYRKLICEKLGFDWLV